MPARIDTLPLPNTLFLRAKQAHYACAKNTTVVELGLLPAEVVAFPGNGVLSCSLGVSPRYVANRSSPSLDRNSPKGCVLSLFKFCFVCRQGNQINDVSSVSPCRKCR